MSISPLDAIIAAHGGSPYSQQSRQPGRLRPGGERDSFTSQTTTATNRYSQDTVASGASPFYYADKLRQAEEPWRPSMQKKTLNVPCDHVSLGEPSPLYRDFERMGIHPQAPRHMARDSVAASSVYSDHATSNLHRGSVIGSLPFVAIREASEENVYEQPPPVPLHQHRTPEKPEYSVRSVTDPTLKTRPSLSQHARPSYVAGQSPIISSPPGSLNGRPSSINFSRPMPRQQRDQLPRLRIDTGDTPTRQAMMMSPDSMQASPVTPVEDMPRGRIRDSWIPDALGITATPPPTRQEQASLQLLTPSPQPARRSPTPTRSATHSATSSPRITTPRSRSQTESLPTTPMQSLTPEDHFALGVRAHEEDRLAQSTAHLRMSAEGGDPRGMLLYAMALRHGWGCAPSPTQAVEWLQKAAEGASYDIAAGETHDSSREDRASVLLTLNPDTPGAGSFKAGRAQLALAIFELGMCYAKGWGVPKDKSLALRFYEVAASWGDADAQAEAGFCLLNGIGCKRNKYKSAEYYRMAAKQGVTIPGNSWIFKDKYTKEERKGNEQESTGTPKKEKRLFWKKKDKGKDKD
ncbi:hypothetical protein YB2330_003267 [Saitoella coloradoensis]